MDIKKIQFQKHGDERGQLVVAENGKELPFVAKRIFYIYGVNDGKRRGYHSHKKVKQVYIAIYGSCKVLLDDGFEKKEFVLNDPSIGLYVGCDIWSELYDFSNDCVFLVLASENYEETDYIRDYDIFIKTVKEKKNEN